MRTVPIVVLILCSSTGFGQAPNQQSIHVDDIGKSVVLIGRLGKPLGSRTRIKGIWEFPVAAKDASIRFQVTEIDDKKLKERLEFSIYQLEVTTEKFEGLLPKPDRLSRIEYDKSVGALAGEIWTLSGYETGSVEIFPFDDDRPRFRLYGMA